MGYTRDMPTVIDRYVCKNSSTNPAHSRTNSLGAHVLLKLRIPPVYAGRCKLLQNVTHSFLLNQIIGINSLLYKY